MYSDSQLKTFWDKYLNDNLELKKSDKKHDDLLYGKEGFLNCWAMQLALELLKIIIKAISYSTKSFL